MPDVSFIISACNCIELTKSMIDSLLAHTSLEDRELILVDDASTDGTAEYMKSVKGRPIVLKNEVNRGFAKSNNRAARRATGDYLVFLNNDLEFSRNWLEPLIELYESEENVGAVGNIQRNFETGLVDHAGIFFDLEGMPTHAWKNRKKLPPSTYRERNAITAACLLVKRSLFLELEGFDEAYRNGMEDVDLCVRIREKGYRLLVSHQSIIRHHISRSPGRHRFNHENSELFRKRWSRQTARFGAQEWPAEYFHRYARYWWRMNPRLALKALFMLIARRGQGTGSEFPSISEGSPKDC
jgi:GT2 family glycosyltransferase